jgi:hypothetical protein
VRRLALGALSVVTVLSLAWAVVRARGTPPPARQGPAAAPTSTPASAPRVRPLELEKLRDIFRFDDERSPLREAPPGPSAQDAAPAAEPSAPRVVGLVRRSGRLLAALAAGGEVEIVAPGESGAGVTVLSVTEDGVRVRRADGSEALLPY